jgi:hypothetical protein
MWSRKQCPGDKGADNEMRGEAEKNWIPANDMRGQVGN